MPLILSIAFLHEAQNRLSNTCNIMEAGSGHFAFPWVKFLQSENSK